MLWSCGTAAWGSIWGTLPGTCRPSAPHTVRATWLSGGSIHWHRVTAPCVPSALALWGVLAVLSQTRAGLPGTRPLPA